MNSKNLLVRILLIMLVIIFVGGSYYLFNSKNNSNQQIQINNQQLEAKQESNEENQGSYVKYFCNKEPCCKDYANDEECLLNYLKNCEYLKMEIKSPVDLSKNLFSKWIMEIAEKIENSKCKINVKLIDYPINKTFNNKEMICIVDIMEDPRQMQAQLSTFSKCSGELVEVMKVTQSK
ncbi:MAG: hypothetical protein QXR30_00240 [Candidatus Woesearchaeota archaeon]